MEQMTEEDKQPSPRKTLHSLCSVSALLLSVVCCIKLIHLELRIQEHHRLMSHSVTFCDQMRTQILCKVQQNYERWQLTKSWSHDGLKDHLQGRNGKEKFYNSNTPCCYQFVSDPSIMIIIPLISILSSCIFIMLFWLPLESERRGLRGLYGRLSLWIMRLREKLNKIHV